MPAGRGRLHRHAKNIHLKLKLALCPEKRKAAKTCLEPPSSKESPKSRAPPCLQWAVQNLQDINEKREKKEEESQTEEEDVSKGEEEDGSQTTTNGRNPPVFTINLSKPPKERYAHVSAFFKRILGNGTLLQLLNEVMDQGCRTIWLSKSLSRILRHTARSIIRRVYDDEEQAEIEGIAEAMDVPVHLLVALNVMVDMMMGCSTMGLKTVYDDDREARMMHLRIMDWYMPRLRCLMVELSYVRQPGGPVIASSLSYFGYIGVFTGVRPGLSMSINFRAHHEQKCPKQRLAYRKHQLQVMTGKRRSLSSHIRQILLTPDVVLDQQLTEEDDDEEDDEEDVDYGKEGVIENRSTFEIMPDSPFGMPILDYIRSPDGLSSIPSTAAYLTFCTPRTVCLLENDHRQAKMFLDDTSLAVCNHDRADVHSAPGANGRLELVNQSLQGETRDYFQLSLNRYVALQTMRQRALEAKERRRLQDVLEAELKGLTTTSPSQDMDFCDIVTMSRHPIVCHDDTHYISIMDPARGRIVWRTGFM